MRLKLSRISSPTSLVIATRAIKETAALAISAEALISNVDHSKGHSEKQQFIMSCSQLLFEDLNCFSLVLMFLGIQDWTFCGTFCQPCLNPDAFLRNIHSSTVHIYNLRTLNKSSLQKRKGKERELPHCLPRPY